ncbi:hypothetical protein SK141_0738 [Streptococcus oralis]|nr:hypothetical protein SK141_0738 [Streptococcus oralis]
MASSPDFSSFETSIAWHFPVGLSIDVDKPLKVSFPGLGVKLLSVAESIRYTML